MQAAALPSHGFYAILDTGYIHDSEWEYKADALLSGGACMLQIRAMGDPLDRVRELVDRILPVAQSHGAPLILNDHVELAASLPGLGLHMGQDDGDIIEVRKQLGPDRMLGLSTHSLEQAMAAIKDAKVLSYFTVGPVFPSLTHPDYKPVGLGLIKEVAALNPTLPFFGIGGINRANLKDLIKAGARRVAASSSPLQDPELEETARYYSDQLKG